MFLQGNSMMKRDTKKLVEHFRSYRFIYYISFNIFYKSQWFPNKSLTEIFRNHGTLKKTYNRSLHVIWFYNYGFFKLTILIMTSAKASLRTTALDHSQTPKGKLSIPRICFE